MTDSTAQVLQPTAAPAQPEYQGDINTDIMEWNMMNEKLKELKKKEMDLRKKIEAAPIFDAHKVKGTQNYELGKGYELKLVRKETVSVTNKDNEAVKAIVALRKLGAVAADRADRLFRFSASLQERVYDELSDQEKEIVDPILTRRQASPTLTLKSP